MIQEILAFVVEAVVSDHTEIFSRTWIKIFFSSSRPDSLTVIRSSVL